MSTTSSHLPSSRLAHHQEGRAVATGPAATSSVLAHAPAVLGTLLLHAALAAGALVMFLPFLWMLTTALKPPAEVYLFPPRLLPSSPTLEHFARILQQGTFAGYFANSVVMALVQTMATVILGAMAGYAFARLEWPGRDGLFWLLVAKMMVPQIIT